MPDRQRSATHHAEPSNSKGHPATIACGYPYGSSTTDWAHVTCTRCLQERPTPSAADTLAVMVALARQITTGQQPALYRDEYDLQTAIADRLGTIVDREHDLSDGRSRVDLWHPTAGIALEVKINSSRADVIRQLTRYAHCPEVAGIILITTRARHHHLPAELNGKPTRLLTLIEAGI